MADLVKEYAKALRVATYEVGAQCILRLSVLLRMCQDVSEQNLSLLGLGYEKMCADGLVFLLITNRAKIRRMPVHTEELVIKTHPRGVAGAQFYRDFIVYSGGEPIISVMQTSVAANAETHKILRPKEFLNYGIFSGEKMPEDERIPKLTVPEDLPLAGERKVRFSDLDYNNHLNNTVYADIVTDFLPGGAEGRQFEEVQINYLNESTLGDTLKIYAGERDGLILMKGLNARGCGFTASAKLKPMDKKDVEIARTHIEK
jgi:acyl-ACP thioesterase